MSRRYPPEVHQFIRDHVEGRTSAELVALTNAACGTDFDVKRMRCYKRNHRLRSWESGNLPKGRPTDMYPAEVRDFIHQNYKGTSYASMAQLLKENFDREYTKNQIMAYYKNHKLDSGLTGRFEKGNVPANKGQRGYAAPGVEKGWFKKGNQTWNTVPVGTVSLKGDGYLWKKIDDIPGQWSHNWRQLHLIVWEEANGPVPKGCVVIFKDGNHENCALENLTLITQAENAVLNKHGLRFETPEHTETGILIAKVKIAAAKRRKGNCHETG